MTRRRFLTNAAAVPALSRPFNTSFVIANSRGEVLQLQWPTAANPVSAGSLLKPFLAVSFLRTVAKPPLIVCRGATAGCWHPHGHGEQTLVSALANSCNVYFRWLVAHLDPAALDLLCLSYGLSLPDREWDRTRLMGLAAGWPQTPHAIVRAFACLVRERADPPVDTALAGMELCARNGTAQAVRTACYAKTGTAICSHAGAGLGDGFALAMYPLAQPRRIVLVMRHNTTGATVARDLPSLLSSAA